MGKEIRHGDTLVDSLSSTPFTSAPSSPGRSSASNMQILTGNGGLVNSTAMSAFFFSAPASPTHFLLSSSPKISRYSAVGPVDLGDADFEFDLSARAMSTADELFVNGQIRSGFVSPNHDLDMVDRNGSVHRRTRSVSPTRSPRLNWRQRKEASKLPKPAMKSEKKAETYHSASSSATTSRSSSSSSTSSNPTSRNSKRWAFIKDLILHRNKSEGKRNENKAVDQESRITRNRSRTNSMEKIGNSVSLNPAVYKDRVSSGRTEEMRRRRTTFLPYQPGLIFGCLGFRRYGAINGFARNISSVSR